MDIFQFMSSSPILSFFIAAFMASAVVGVAKAICGIRDCGCDE